MTTTESGLAISYTKEKFEAGEYKFIIEVFTNDAYKENFEFANNFNLIVDGKDCICVPVMPSIKAGPREWIPAATADPEEDKTVISQLNLTSNIDKILEVGHAVEEPTFNITDSALQGKIKIKFEGWKKSGQDSPIYYSEEVFNEGDYSPEISLSIEEAYKDAYEFAFDDELTITLDGKACRSFAEKPNFPLVWLEAYMAAEAVVDPTEEYCTIYFAPGTYGQGSMDNATVTKGSKYKLPACGFTSSDPSKDFDHWSYVDGDDTVYAIPEQEITVNSDIKVTAEWADITPPTNEKIKVTFIKNKHGGDPAIIVKEIDKGTTVERPDDPEDDAFDFGGWYTEDECRNPFDFESIIEINTELFAKWTPKTQNPNDPQNPPTNEKVKVTFIKNKHGGDPATFVKEIDKGSKVEKPDDPEDESFDFLGWYMEDECRTEFDFNTIIETNTELFAKWTPKTQNPPDPQNPPTNEKVTITFDPGAGSGTMASVEVNKNSKYKLPACEFEAPPNQVFTGWKYGDIIYGAETEIDIGDTDITLIAQWEDWQNPPPASDKVKVHFLAGEGSGTMASVEVNKNSEYKLPASTFTAPLNKEFKAWQYNDEEKAVGATITVGETDIRLLALWKDKTTTPITPPTPPTPPRPPYRPSYDDDDYYYRPHRPYRPYRPVEEKTEVAKNDREELILKVILTENSKELEKYINAVKSITLMDVAPYIKDGRIMLPIRYISEALGMSVTWDVKTRTVFISDMFYSVEIPVDTNIIKVNGEVYTSDVKPEIKNGRTMMPIANIARALGLKDGKDIIWDSATRKATIIRKITK